MCVKRMLYCPGSGQELLSAFGVTMECHDSSVFLVRKLPLLITEALLKSMEWSWDHAWFQPNTSEGKERELNHVYAALESNGYPSKFIHDLQTKKTRPPPNLSRGTCWNVFQFSRIFRATQVFRVPSIYQRCN